MKTLPANSSPTTSWMRLALVAALGLTLSACFSDVVQSGEGSSNTDEAGGSTTAESGTTLGGGADSMGTSGTSSGNPGTVDTTSDSEVETSDGQTGSSDGQGESCGDGILGKMEACDDGNTEEVDGCASNCELAPLGITYGRLSVTGLEGGTLATGVDSGVEMCPAGAVLVGISGGTNGQTVGVLQGLCQATGLRNRSPDFVPAFTTTPPFRELPSSGQSSNNGRI
ncbi:MAG: DUF4215 domain-containing protein, partial [Nannocystaceae bacterium]|nr:DUF4215 domain-containing protein [Nannocystaceae bacterium]